MQTTSRCLGLGKGAAASRWLVKPPSPQHHPTLNFLLQEGRAARGPPPGGDRGRGEQVAGECPPRGGASASVGLTALQDMRGKQLPGSWGLRGLYQRHRAVLLILFAV